MGLGSLSGAITCPNCGASAQGSSDACPACGGPLPGFNEYNETRQEGLRSFIEEANQSLIAAGAQAAESAFGLGCWLGALISLMLVAILFALGTRHLIILAIIFFGGALITTGIAAALSTKARSASVVGTYRRDIRPAIDSYIRSNRYTNQEFDSMADEILAGDAPLRSSLSQPDRKEPSTED